MLLFHWFYEANWRHEFFIKENEYYGSSVGKIDVAVLSQNITPRAHNEEKMNITGVM
jgi:hypothetical protein